MLIIAACLAFLYYIKKINSSLHLVEVYLLILCVGAVTVWCVRNKSVLFNVLCWIMVGLSALESGYNVYLAFSQYNNDAKTFTNYSLGAEKIVKQLNDDSGDSFYRYENNFNYLYSIGREIATGESLLY